MERANIVEVAVGLGLQVERRQAEPRKAICPFHDDKDPSLSLYGSRNGKRGHYHCFVCGAHGDAIKLVQTYENLTFGEAVTRLARLMGEDIPGGLVAQSDRRAGGNELSELIQKASSRAKAGATYAVERGFDPAWLRERGVANLSLTPLIEKARKDRVLEEALVAAGIARRRDEGEVRELWQEGLRGFFSGERLVFQINDERGVVAGFAARSLTNNKPKYLYSYGFPRRDVLYRADAVMRRLESEHVNSDGQPFDLYIVEGLFDALRFEALGFNAVGILGARMTPGQLDVLRGLAIVASRFGRELNIHIFLDRDEAGRLGAYDASLAILRMLEDEAPFSLDVIWPAEDDGKKIDPDTALRALDRQAATSVLSNWSVQPLTFLASHLLALDPRAIEWDSVSRLKRASAARTIAQSIAGVGWTKIAASLTTSDRDSGLVEFAELVSVYAQPALSRSPSLLQDTSFRSTPDTSADLLTALTLARSSTSRREYPTDDASWDRLGAAASTALHLHAQRLKLGDGPSTTLLAREIPKGGGRYRLKRGPVAEDALIQQYILIELLRTRPDCPAFEMNVPAVRYALNRDGDGVIYCTGSDHDAEPVSFAYQIDMAIVNGEAPPRREGPFRPYFDCWRSFIDFVESKIKAFHHDELQILRLDVAGFYDNIRRDAVEDALTRPLAAAISALAASDGGVGAFAKLFRPEASESPERRAEATTDFLLKHTFGLKHRHPDTGQEVEEDPLKGIPQGPDLSAYLANISLFELDELMRREIAQINAALSDRDACGAAYARYVDDIVIVCADLSTASLLRRKIEAHLATLGLSLNRKNATPPPMTREEARAWITDNRAGFGFSGPLADLPTTEAMDPLAEAGDIDRKTALGLLYDPELDDPANSERTISRIGWALQAPDLRFNDRASAYRRLWTLAASGTPVAVEQVAGDFLSLVREVDPAVLLVVDGDPRRDILLACIEGLDRALRLSVPSGMLPDAACEEIAARTQALAHAVLQDVFTPLVSAFGEDAQGSFLRRYDVRTQICMIGQLAAQIVARNGEVELGALRKYTDGTAKEQPLYSGLLWSLHRFDRRIFGPSEITVTRSNATSVAFAQLHGAIVKLQRLGRIGGQAEELLPLSEALLADPEHIVSSVNQILRIWSPDTDSAGLLKPTQLELDAAATLVNLTHSKFAEVAERRPHLLSMIAGHTDARPLPSPPGLQTHGLLLWRPDGQLLLAKASEDIDDPVGVEWVTRESVLNSSIVLKTANLPAGCEPVFIRPQDWTPRLIAETYRAFFSLWRKLDDDAGEAISVPTVFSFFARLDNGAICDHRMVSWTASPTTVDGHAFVRTGQALEARSVFAEGADFWRFGWAIRDLCGRDQVPGDDEDGAEAQASARLERDTHRREAILSRVLPRLSGADRWGPGEIKPGKNMPTRIERGLRLLERFGEGTVGVDAAYLVSALSEGLFMNERVNGSDNLSIPGAPVSLLARAARRAMRAVPEAAVHWATVEEPSAPYRRTALAWFTVATRLRLHLADLGEGAAHPLRSLALGAEVLGVVADLRALVFELAGGLDRTVLERLSSIRIAQGWLHDVVGSEIRLVDDSRSLDPAADVQIKRLLEVFSEIVLGTRAGTRGLRDIISPSGWVVLAATLLQVLVVDDDEVGLRPRLWPMDLLKLERAEKALTVLLKAIAPASSAVVDSDEWPWDAFAEIYEGWPEDLGETLRELTEAATLSVTTCRSGVNPRGEDAYTGRQTVRLSDGTSIGISDWQVDIAHIRGEKGIATESREVSGRMQYAYSLTWAGERLLGLHLVSRQLSATAFGRQEVGNSDAAEDTEQLNLASLSADKDAPVVGMDDTRPVPNSRPNRSTIERGDFADDKINVIRQLQQKAWRVRAGYKGFGRQRVALLQWDVVDSYEAPGAKLGRNEGLLKSTGAIVDEKDLKIGGAFASTTEYRRRAILKAALSACIDFGVDGLVLPEYSLRPETVNWLARQLKQTAAPIIVWCGTFRLPGGTQLDYQNSGGEPYLSVNTKNTPVGRDRFDDHTALLTCLRVPAGSRAGDRVKVAVRRKRYPSAAAGELIRPPVNEPWRPLLEDANSPFDLASFSLELICSEMFPHASSANFVGIIDENEVLARRYGLVQNTTPPFEYLTCDVYEFAKWTSYRNRQKIQGDTDQHLWRGQRLQRTLIVLPAMTTRSADYHIFGQNQYLAAGLVTVFCNAVETHYACGESCFIGLDGWRETEPPTSPYWGIAPGIFQIGAKKHSGPLGRGEAAMVIADLDLMRTSDQKPRPHYQDKPLELVAHLPLIFHTEAAGGGVKGDDPHGRRRIRLRALDASNSDVSFDQAVETIYDALAAEKEWRAEMGVLQADRVASVAHDAAVAAIDAGLRTIAAFSEKSEWADKRRKAFSADRFKYPSSTPCPALVDWIYVDDRWVTGDRGDGFDADQDPLLQDYPRLTVPRTISEPDRKPA
ncbi:hypothetical protein GCM10009093_11550 [Brevundimonas terrae]|uniref:Reverse transcriptase domain-containing protein n=1 Tax=Brevundimonas terrae TaxID=363631 RepID=A0ABN0Y7W0_9CAUL